MNEHVKSRTLPGLRYFDVLLLSNMIHFAEICDSAMREYNPNSTLDII
jgi:hypothetical protein